MGDLVWKRKLGKSIDAAAIYLAYPGEAPGIYKVRGAYGGHVGVLPSFDTLPSKWTIGPFLGYAARGERDGLLTTTIAGHGFQSALIRAAERGHGPVVWAVVRRCFRERNGGRVGRVALGVRTSDGKPVAIVSQIEDSAHA